MEKGIKKSNKKIKGYKITIENLENGEIENEIVTDCTIMVSYNLERVEEVRQFAITACRPQVLLCSLKSLKNLEKRLMLSLTKDMLSVVADELEDEDEGE